MLRLENIEASYGPLKALFGVSLTVEQGEILCLLGRNGAGKTTTLRAIMGHVPVGAGRVLLDGEDITRIPPHQVPGRGVGYIPQGRRLFPDLSVAETLEVGLLQRKGDRATRDWVLSLFPRLKERLGQQAGTLSGGEQQMLATARALCLRPKVLLLDEPTEGLQPSMIAQIREVVLKMRDEGVAIVLVEQRVDAVMEVADRVVFLENGRSVDEMTQDALHADPGALRRYLGV